MVHLNRIYTRSGDQGQTSLGDGTRVLKTSDRVVALGSVDELNAILGVALATGDLSADLADCLTLIQNTLFDLGADLCVPISASDSDQKRLRIQDDVVTWLESQIDFFNAGLEALDSFILPGGTPGAAHLHHARAVCRRAEIDVLRLAESETVNRSVAIFLNRLSDLLFVMARWCNHVANRADILWRYSKPLVGPSDVK
ncbi:MAG: cob(I)yrinic acid a,c-diamide adenosyltransferase [Planctomycetaceae bacterium]|nr:cob(I)yrinic acid a,c-diamide adenosyltransferase [Planctomycetaceae bacterium]